MPALTRAFPSSRAGAASDSVDVFTDTRAIELNDLDVREMVQFAGIAAAVLFALIWLLLRSR